MEEEENALKVVFNIDEDHYQKLDDDGKINYLCVLQDIIDAELYRVYMGKSKPLNNEA